MFQCDPPKHIKAIWLFIYVAMAIGFIVLALLLSACKELPTVTPAPTATVAPSATPTVTAMVTPTVIATATIAPVRRAVWDCNTFPVGSQEWQAWQWYDAELRRLDALAKARGDVGLTAAEQMRIWVNALRKFGMLDGE